MCISAYHFLHDLWEVPLLIKSYNSRYKIFYRHHSFAAWDTDCYTIL